MSDTLDRLRVYEDVKLSDPLAFRILARYRELRESGHLSGADALTRAEQEVVGR